MSARMSPGSCRARLLAVALVAAVALLVLGSPGALGAARDAAAAGLRVACGLGLPRRGYALESAAGPSAARRLAPGDSLASNQSVMSKGQVDWRGQIQSSSHPKKCLDVRDGGAWNGNRVQLWDCLEHSASQRFSWSKSDKKLRWEAHGGRFCVDVFDHKNENGNHLQIWECQDHNRDQAFVLPSLVCQYDSCRYAEISGKIRWHAHMDKCIDVRDHSFTNGNTIQIWTCIEGNADQSFIIVPGGPSWLPRLRGSRPH